MNKIVVGLTIVLIVSTEVVSKLVSRNVPRTDEGQSESELDSTFIKEQCFGYGLSINGVISARIVHDGCSVECDYTNTKVNVDKPNGHPCVPKVLGHSCYFGQCLENNYTRSNDNVVLNLRLLHSSIPMPQLKLVYMVALIDNDQVGKDTEEVLCMTARIKRSQLWWYHRCQTRLVARDSFIRFELRSSSVSTPLWVGETKLGAIRPNQGLFNIPMRPFQGIKDNNVGEVDQRPTRTPGWQPSWPADRSPGWEPDGILPDCLSTNSSVIRSNNSSSEQFREMKMKPYLTITVSYRNETSKNPSESSAEEESR